MDNLPVVIKKSRGQLEPLANKGCKQRRLCPHSKLLAFLDAQEVVKIHSFSNTSVQCTIDSDRYTSILWVNKGSFEQGHVESSDVPRSSYLLTLTLSKDLKLYRVEHKPLYNADEEVEGSKTALLPFKLLSLMCRKQISNMLSKANLDKNLETFSLIGTSEGGDIAILVNGGSVVRLALDPSSLQLSLSAIFSIEPNMSVFDDELLPQYVGRITFVQVVWPLLFSLTEDGIVLVYNVTTSECLCAINPTEYCKLFYPHHPDAEESLHLMSSSSFIRLAISPDLMKLAVSSSSHHTILVNLPSYFKSFPNHYPLSPSARSPHRSLHIRGSYQANKIPTEEEDDMLKYGGLSRRQRGLGMKFHGPFVGSFASQKGQTNLKDKIRTINLTHNKRLNLSGTLSMDDSKNTSSSSQDASLKWYEQPEVEKKTESYDSDQHRNSTNDVYLTSSFGKRGGSLTPYNVPMRIRHSRNSSFVNQSTSFPYQFNCILPSPDSHITPDGSNSTPVDVLESLSDNGHVTRSRLLHLDCNYSIVVGYFTNDGCEPESSVSSTEMGLGQSVTHIAVYNLSEQTYFVVKLPVPNLLILPTRLDKPVYLASVKHLSLAAFTLAQEDFVAKVLMYGSARVAEEVCHLNRWDQCSLPLNALETALELRQLDTVSFFLRNRDSLSQQSQGAGSAEGVVPSSRPPPPPPLPPDQLDAAVDLLTHSIQCNHNTEHNRQFAGQLLGMTLNFLLRLNRSQSHTEDDHPADQDSLTSRDVPATLSSSVESSSGPSILTDSLENYGFRGGPPTLHNLNVTAYIQNLRQYIPKPSHSTSVGGHNKRGGEEAEQEDPEGFEYRLTRAASKESWDNKSSKDVIRQALIAGNLPLAHAYLIDKTKKCTTSSLSHDVKFHSLVGVGLGFVMEALSGKNIKQATLLLSQLGADIKQSLRFIFLRTVQRQLREFLANELGSNGWITDAELDGLEFLRVLESYYPLEEYKKAEELYLSTQSSSANKRLSSPHSQSLSSWMEEDSGSGPLVVGDITDLYPEYFRGDQAVIMEPASSGVSQRCFVYLQVPVYVVLDWDSVTRQRILYEGIILSGKSKDSISAIDHLVHPQHQVVYHLTHHDPSTVEDSPLETAVTVELIESLSSRNQCSQYIKDLFLDRLAREGTYGSVCEEELTALLCRLGRVHTLFSEPHPLAIAGDSKTAVEKFHFLFIRHLIERKFVGLLYLYLDYYQLATDRQSITILGINTADLPPWVDYLIHCRLAARNPTEPSSVFSASLSCSQLLKGTSSVSEGLQNGLLLMSLATLMYAPVPISECLSVTNSNKLWYIDQNQLKQALVAFPTLQAAIFPSKSKRLTPAESQDISVYQLLKEGVPFDMSRIFKWQKTNIIAAADDNMEEPQEMPHFSRPHLSQKYAQAEKLTYQYFLCQGQPSFALANFVAAKLANRSNPNKRIDKAVSHVYRLTMTDFANPKLVSSCVAFLEMLSRDSTPLRIDTQAAKRIHTYLWNKESKGVVTDQEKSKSEEKSLRKRIGSQFIQLQQTPNNHTLGTTLLRKLEEATCYHLKSTEIANCSTDAEMSWNLVQQFCLCHTLPPSLEYLKECSKKGMWLPLLCHAQLYKVPVKEILSVVDKNFTDPVVKEHLQLALSTMDSVPLSSSLAGQSGRNANGRSKGKSKRKYKGIPPSSSPADTRLERRELSQRDRAKFYSKFGLSTPSKLDDTSTTSSPYMGAVSTPIQSIDTSLMSPHVQQVSYPPILSENLPDDLFSVLFHCQDHPSPWQALLAYGIALQRPLLALLAGCYPGSSLVDCMCVWLCSTIGMEATKKVSSLLNISRSHIGEELRFNSGLQWKRWIVDDLAYLLLAAMLTTPSQASQLVLLFEYFDKENLLYSFMRFQEEFVVRLDLDESKKHLKEFGLQLDKVSRLGRYPGLVGDTQWVEDIVVTFVGHMIVTCPTPFEKSQLLELLVESGFGDDFKSKHIADFRQLYEISSILQKANLSSVPAFKITGEFNTSAPSSSPPSLLDLYAIRVRIDSDHVLGVLIEKGLFRAAREYAKVAEVSLAEVTIKEVESQHQKLMDSSYWQYQPARFSFWQKCHTSFVRDGVSPEAAAEFFESVVQNSPSLSCNEKTLLLVLALKWRKDGNLCSPSQERETEKQIWLSHLSALAATTAKVSQQSLRDLLTDPSISPTFYRHPSQGQLPLPILSALCITGSPNPTEPFTLHQLVLPDTVPVALQKEGKSLLTKEESETLDVVVGRLVDVGWISQARELAALFDHESTDLTIVLCCIQLASNKLTPDQLTQDVLDLLANRTPQRSMGHLHMGEEGGARNTVSMEILGMLQQLAERAVHVQNCCFCVINCFKIATALHKPFSSIVTGDSFDTLAEVLSNRHADKYSLAASFVKSTNMQPEQVAGFLSSCIAASLQSAIGEAELDYSRVKVYEPNMTTSQFMNLCRLCSGHALLGQHLLSMAKSLSGTEKPSEDSLMVQVELLIRSHDCYTLDCSVDGVAEILKVSREITNVLYQGKHYKLMVRLLTGVGRFHEMNYIIHLLLECDEFESLVHPKVEKVEQLKVALMEYLRKHSRDSEKMEMVALKFEMYRELGCTREERGMREVQKLKHKQLVSNNFETVKVLKQIYADFRDAAEIYAKDDCMSNSEHCLSQARLVALQLSVLHSGKQVLNLDAKSVQKFMEEQPFIEALVVANAYKRTPLADWVNPLYQQVVVKGNMRYLSDFTSVFPLTNSIMQDLASKYLLERSRSQDMSSNMKKILSYCSSLILKNKIFSQLGLQDTHSPEHIINDGFLADVTKL